MVKILSGRGQTPLARLIDQIVNAINDLRGIDAEEVRQDQKDRDDLDMQRRKTEPNAELITDEEWSDLPGTINVLTSPLLKAPSITAADVEVILNEIIDELPSTGIIPTLKERPLIGKERDDYIYAIASTLLNFSIESNNPMFDGKPNLYAAIRAREREIQLFPDQATRNLQMREVVQYVIQAYDFDETGFEAWVAAYPDAFSLLKYEIPDIMKESVEQTGIGLDVKTSEDLFKQLFKVDESGNIIRNIVIPEDQRAAAEFQLRAKRLLLDGEGNFKTPDGIVDAIIDESGIRNTKAEMVDPDKDWPAFQTWRSKLIEKITNLKNELIRDGADTYLLAVHLVQRVETAIKYEMPREMERYKLDVKTTKDRIAKADAPLPNVVAIAKTALEQNGLIKSSITPEDYTSLTDYITETRGDLNKAHAWVRDNEERLKQNMALEGIRGIDKNDAEVLKVLARVGILREDITDDDFKALKFDLFNRSLDAGSSFAGQASLEAHLSAEDRLAAIELLQNKKDEVERELQAEVSTETGATAAVKDLFFKDAAADYPELGLKFEDLTEEWQEWMTQYVSKGGVEALSRYLRTNPLLVKRILTDKKRQAVVSEGIVGLESLLAQMGYGGVVDGISQIDVILKQLNVPEVLEEIANSPGTDPTDIVMTHLGLKEPERHPIPPLLPWDPSALPWDPSAPPYDPPFIDSPTEREFYQGPGDPFKPARVFGTELPDLEELARLQEAHRDPSVPPSLPIAPEDRTIAQEEAYALFPDMPSMGGVEALPVSMRPTPAVALPRGFEESGGWGVARDTVLGPEMEAMIARRAGGDVSLIPYLQQEARVFLPEFRRGVQETRAESTANLMKSAREAEVASWETKMAAWDLEGDAPVIGGWDEEEHGGIALKDMIRGMRATAEAETREFMPAFEERIATLPRVMELRKAKRLRLKGRPRFV